MRIGMALFTFGALFAQESPAQQNLSVLYTAVWRPSMEGETQVYGWKYEDYRAKYDELWNQGWRLYILQAYTVAGPPILEISYNNPAYDTSAPTWARDVCRGQKFFADEFPPYEWMQVLNPASEADDDIVGMTGVAVMPKLSDQDVPFTHPFGFDWEFFIAPDPQYTSLLAPSNVGPDAEYVEATSRAPSLGLSVPKGVLGVETDQDLVPLRYRANEGDRVAVFGRWSADCGHTDFHTEIHPPLLLVTARPGGGAVDPNMPFPLTEATSSFIISRPWLVSQRFEVDNEAIRQHLINEVAKVEESRSLRVEAHPKIRKPFSGDYLIGYTLRPPTPRRSPNDRLSVSFHFTVRHGVAVQVYKTGNDTVSVLISMNGATYQAAHLPDKNDWDIPLDSLSRYTDLVDKVRIADVVAAALGLDPFGLLSSWALSRDWLTDRYDAPTASSVHDSEITRMAVEDLQGNTPFSVEDGQPFPIYGQMRVQWERH
jgi:hypothetical protein